eukprot:gene7712-8330_t
MSDGISPDEISIALGKFSANPELSTDAAALNAKLQPLSEKQKLVALHVLLLNHTLVCQGCTSPNCAKMQHIIAHRENCELEHCDFCQRIDKLYAYHSCICKRKEECQACSRGKFAATNCMDCMPSLSF